MSNVVLMLVLTGFFTGAVWTHDVYKDNDVAVLGVTAVLLAGALAALVQSARKYRHDED